LEQAKHKTIRQIEVLVAHLAPQPDVPSTLRALPNRTVVTAPATPVAAPLAASTPVAPLLPARAPVEPAPIPPAPAPLPPRRDPDPAPLAPRRWKLQVTISQSSHDKLEQLQALLAHKIPNGDPAAIIERALDALLTQVRKRKIGMTDKPRAPKPESTVATPRGRHVPAAERREVWPRDDGRCGFVGEDGRRCNETRALQFAHIEPWAKGGANTADNLGLRCQAHNALEADRDYGASFMTSKRKQNPLKVREPVARYRLRCLPDGHCSTPLSPGHRDVTAEWIQGQPGNLPSPATDPIVSRFVHYPEAPNRSGGISIHGHKIRQRNDLSESYFLAKPGFLTTIPSDRPHLLAVARPLCSSPLDW